MSQGAVYISPVEQTHHPAVFHHRVAFVAVALHAQGSFPDGSLGSQHIHPARHNLRYCDRRAHKLGQALFQLSLYLLDGAVAHQAGSRAFVPAAAQPAEHSGDIDMLAGRAGDDLHPGARLDKHKEGIRVEQITQLMGNR